jgi:large subunit ribosomal protein L5
MTSLTKKTYETKARPALARLQKTGNVNALPKIDRVVVNVGIGKFVKEANRLDEIQQALEMITGQKVVRTKARKAIAGFKIREGLEVGMRTTLRGRRMWDFLDRLINIALPRVRDFQGIPRQAVDAFGNCNIGIREHMVFPEIVPEKVQTIFGFQITIVTTAKDKASGEMLFQSIGLPLQATSAMNQSR